MSALPSNLTMLDAALSFAARGWPVAPAHEVVSVGKCSCGRVDCEPKDAGKHPRTSRGLLDATLDSGIIRNWWSRWPSTNVMLVTGEGLMVLDVDPDAGGDESLAALEARHGKLPETPRVVTGRGGAHYYFSVPCEVRCSAGKLGAGLDVRGDGGYVIAPPSRHGVGRSYTWDAGAHLDEVPLAPCPTWLLDLIARRAPKPSTAPVEGASLFVQGGRNAALASLGGTMRKRGFDGEAIEAALLVENEKKCRPSLDPAEVKRIARSVARYEPTDVPAGGEAGAKAAADPWNLMTAAQIFAPLPPYPWLVKGLHLAPGRITLLAGSPDTGKTVVVMSIALGVASGKSVWGVHRPTRGKVLHLNGELGSYIARERYQRLARGMGIDVADLADTLVLSNYPAAKLDDPGFEGKMVAACTGVALVVVDSLRAFSGALEEKSKEIGVALLMLARVSEKTGAVIVVLHHNRKPSKDDVGRASDAISGSNSIFGGCECAFVMSKEKNGPVTVQHERSPLGRPMPDFGLSIEDVEAEGDPRWGLRVVHMEGEQMARAEEAAKASRKASDEQRASEAVLETLRRFAGVFRGSREAFRAAVGIGKEPFGLGLAFLENEHRVRREGTYHAPEWHLNGG